MIPKKIHYCWLSGETIPDNLQNCLNSWKEIMPDYELIRWDTNKFDISSNIFVNEAYDNKKWAFAADYIRLHALYTEGGIYMDLDVLVKKSFDDFLQYNFFSSIEYHHELVKRKSTLDLLHEDGSSKELNTPKPGIGIQAAVLGSIKDLPFLKDCLDVYKTGNVVFNKGGNNNNQVIAPDIYAMVAEKYGFKYKDELQILNDNMLILPSEIIAGSDEEETDNSYAIHYCTGSWRDEPSVFFKFWKYIINLKKIVMKK
jgi:mannosyltransferase OCH1-like enzyme